MTLSTHIHLMVIHFAIALLSLASIGFWAYKLKPYDKLLFATDLALIIGTIAAIVALISGAFAWHYFTTHHPVQVHWLRLHRFWALVTVAIYTTGLIWRSYQILLKKPVSWPVRLLTLAGLVALVLTGYYAQFLIGHH